MNDPSDLDGVFLNHVRAALRQMGRLLPTTDFEVEQALEAIEADDEETQTELSDPYELYRTGTSNSNLRLVEPEQETDRSAQEFAERSMVLAAREGEDIPPEIRRKMDALRARNERTSTGSSQPDEESSED